MRFSDLLNEGSKSFDRLVDKNEFPIFKYFKDEHLKELKKEIINNSKHCKYKNRIEDIDFGGNTIMFEVSFPEFRDYNDDSGDMYDFSSEFLRSSFYTALKNLGLSFIIYTDDVSIMGKFNTLMIEICVKDIYKETFEHEIKKHKEFEYLKTFIDKIK
jgi:hypothetical protein|nr:MAG TPA: hypothetical protein [Caudoviricetes sp.]